jgi:thiamine-phosphate pyrophosphorylase
MPPRQPSARTLPKLWLFTDARMGDALWRALAALPPRGGVVVRHDHLAKGARTALVRRVRRITQARRMTLLLAGAPFDAVRIGADGAHLRRPSAAAVRRAHAHGLPVSAPVHDRLQAAAATRAGVDLIFISPVFATRSHVGAPVLGVSHYRRLLHGSRTAAVPLGGMTPARARMLHLRAQGGRAPSFAAIDSWLDAARR